MRLEIFFLIIFLPTVLASCSNEQIDLNSASLTELDKLTGIGPVYAQRIIDSRPYSSIDDLLKINGIGSATLEKIKSQDLACISEEDSKDTTPKQVISEEKKEISPENLPADLQQVKTENIINLNSGETISNSVQKEEVIFESKNEKVKRYLIFAFAFFLILIIIFLLLTN